MQRLNIIFILLLLASSHKNYSQNNIIEAFPNLEFERPVDLQNAGDGSNRIFVVEQQGIIHTFANNSSAANTEIFLDITDRVDDGENELGLLGLAFHPDYETNGYFYVNYTAGNPLRTVISRFSVSSGNQNDADESSELILLEFNQPNINHNGGQLVFGPDGYLYIATGDGGGASLASNNPAKDLSSLLGKILRIDVNNTEDGLNYSIPSDNPYKDNSQGYREEIYAYGLRNPWRISFDAETGELWCADVGEEDYEEINIIEPGKNYGWNCYEGDNLFFGNCMPSYVSPIYVYDAVEQSITGGFVYRGTIHTDLIGKYIFADFMHNDIWWLERNGDNVNTFLINQNTPNKITSFGVDENNEIYIVGFNPGPDKIYKFNPVAFPVELTSFTAESYGNYIILKWNTETEVNNSGFEIERKSSENNNWTRIGFTEGFGNSNNPQTYSYKDENVKKGIKYYYRLKQLDTDGTSNYSPTVEAIIAPDEFSLSQNFPNPFNPSTTINYNLPEKSRIIIKIFDVLGKEIKVLIDSEQEAGFHEIKWDGTNSANNIVPSGVYFFRMEAGSFSETKKMNFLH